VQYPTVWITTTGEFASAPRAIYYNPAPTYQHNPIPNDLLPSPSTLSPNVIMFASVFPYLWLNPYTGQGVLNITCPTSRCTWAPFNTLSVCSKCVETPSLLEFGCYMSPNDWMNDTYTYPYSPDTPSGYTETNSCGWFLTTPNGPPILMSGYSTGNSSTNSSFVPQVLMGRTTPLRDIHSRELLYPGRPSLNFPEIQNPIIDFISSGTPDGIQGALNNATPIVHECLFYWCVNTISLDVVNSQVIENVTASTQVPSTFANNPWFDPVTSWYQSEFSLVLPDSQLEGGCANFSVNNVTARATYQALELIIPSSWMQGFQAPDTQQPPDPGQTYVKYQWRIPEEISLQLSNVNATQWLPPGNVTELVTSLAQVMSTALRRTAIGFTTDIPQWIGDAWEEETRVRVRWPWIILPACLLIFSFIFLAITILRSNGNGNIRIWKSSTLAILFNGLGEDVQRHVGSGPNLGEARARARKLTVHLDE
jgi:hypothetical protein